MTPNEQNKNEKLSPNAVWGKYPCPPEMTNKVIPIVLMAVNYCNLHKDETMEAKAIRLTLALEAEYEAAALYSHDCTLEDIQAHGLALGIACRYRDSIIPSPYPF